MPFSRGGVDHDTHELVGIVSLGDLPTQHFAQVDRTMEEISSLAQPDRSKLH